MGLGAGPAGAVGLPSSLLADADDASATGPEAARRAGHRSRLCRYPAPDHREPRPNPATHHRQTTDLLAPLCAAMLSLGAGLAGPATSFHGGAGSQPAEETPTVHAEANRGKRNAARVVPPGCSAVSDAVPLCDRHASVRCRHGVHVDTFGAAHDRLEVPLRSDSADRSRHRCRPRPGPGAARPGTTPHAQPAAIHPPRDERGGWGRGLTYIAQRHESRNHELPN